MQNDTSAIAESVECNEDSPSAGNDYCELTSLKDTLGASSTSVEYSYITQDSQGQGNAKNKSSKLASNNVACGSSSEIRNGETSSPNDVVPSFKFIESIKGGKILLRAGHRYRMNKKNKGGSSVWKCVNRFCKASVTLNCDVNRVLRDSKHTCIPD